MAGPSGNYASRPQNHDRVANRMSYIQSYRGLVAWQKAMAMVKQACCLTDSYPDTERFGLTSQIRRAAVSIPCNRAEGQGRLGTAEFRQFFGIAKGSLKELETLLLLSVELAFVNRDDVVPILSQADEIGRMINALLKSLRSRLVMKSLHYSNSPSLPTTQFPLPPSAASLPR